LASIFAFSRRIQEGLFRRVATGLIGVIGVVLIIRAL
jgi:hypothetical protein